jgi:DNA polymerase-1
MMMKRRAKHPEYFVIARDSPQKTFRHEQFEDYKANRKKMDDDFKTQIPIIHQIINELQIPSLAIPGYEADDLLASLIRTYQNTSDLSLSLFSSDKDLKQVLTDGVSIVDPVKDQAYQKTDFLTEFGFEPPYIVDYLSLLGDVADNVKGVPGIGDKKALYLIQKYQTLENIYDHLDELDASMVRVLTAGKESAFVSKSLIQLAHVNVADIPLDTFKLTLNYENAAHTLCDCYGFQGFRKTLTEMKKEAEMPQQLGLF